MHVFQWLFFPLPNTAELFKKYLLRNQDHDKVMYTRTGEICVIYCQRAKAPNVALDMA